MLSYNQMTAFIIIAHFVSSQHPCTCLEKSVYSYLLSWLIKKGEKKYFVSALFPDSLGFIFPSWLTH